MLTNKIGKNRKKILSISFNKSDDNEVIFFKSVVILQVLIIIIKKLCQNNEVY